MALPKQENFAGLSYAQDLINITGWSALTGSIKGGLGGGTASPATAGPGTAVYAWTGDTFGNDQYAQIVVGAAGAANAYMGLSLRASSSGCYYLLVAPGVDSVGFIGTLTNSWATDTDIRHFVCPSAGTTLRLEVNGTTFTLKGNGSIIQTQPSAGGSYTDTFTDSTITSGGSAGLCTYGELETPTGDDWEGGVVGGGGSNPTPTTGNVTLTGNSSPMDYKITPKMARTWQPSFGGILVPA